MTCTYRTIQQHISAEPSQVRSFYVDLSDITELHPLVVSVQTSGPRPLQDGYVQTYSIRDRVPVGPVGLPIRYRAALTVPTAGDVVAESFQFPRVRLHTVVSFEEHDGDTLLTERMRICAPRPLLGFTADQAVAAHREMLARMAERFSRAV